MFSKENKQEIEAFNHSVDMLHGKGLEVGGSLWGLEVSTGSTKISHYVGVRILGYKALLGIPPLWGSVYKKLIGDWELDELPLRLRVGTMNFLLQGILGEDICKKLSLKVEGMVEARDKKHKSFCRRYGFEGGLWYGLGFSLQSKGLGEELIWTRRFTLGFLYNESLLKESGFLLKDIGLLEYPKRAMINRPLIVSCLPLSLDEVQGLETGDIIFTGSSKDMEVSIDLWGDYIFTGDKANVIEATAIQS